MAPCGIKINMYILGRFQKVYRMAMVCIFRLKIAVVIREIGNLSRNMGLELRYLWMEVLM